MDIRSALTAAQQRVEEIMDRFFQEHPDQRHAWERKAPYMKLFDPQKEASEIHSGRDLEPL